MHFAGNRASDNALIASARRGLRIARNVRTEAGVTRSIGNLTFDDTNTYTHTIKNVDGGGSTGNYTDYIGASLITAMDTGAIINGHIANSGVIYYHGPNFASTNRGGLHPVTGYTMQNGDKVYVNDVEYEFVTSGATGNQINLTGVMNTEVVALGAILTTNLDGIATVTVVDNGAKKSIIIAPVDTEATMSVDCSISAASRLFPLPCQHYDIATELLRRNFVNVSAVAPCFRIANGSDWANI
jgi:hypothetical protein